MNALDYLLRFPWVEPLGRTLLHFLWQGALIGLTASLLLRLARRRSPALRHLIAASALTACAVFPLGTFLWLAHPWRPAVRIPGTVFATPPAVAINPAAPLSKVVAVRPIPAARSPLLTRRPTHDLPRMVAPSISSTWQATAVRWAVVLWSVGVTLLGSRLCIGWARVQLWRGRARSIDDARLISQFRALAGRLGIHAGRVRLLVSYAPDLPGPLAMGAWWPVVLLPAKVLERLPLAQIEALLAHELAHIRRHDYLWNLLASALEVALFYHPAMWFLGRELRATREECCDDLTAEVCPDRVAYARALAAVAEGRATALLGVPAPAAARSPLVTRVRRLLGLDVPPDPLFTGRNVGGMLALASVVLAATGILHSGKLMAQNDDDPNIPTLVRAAPHGRVVGRDGQPVAGARVLLYRTVSEWGLGNRVEAETSSGSDGGFTFAQPLRIKNPAAARSTAEYTIFAVAAGQAPVGAPILPETSADQSVTLIFPATKPQTYEVLDKAGRPVEGATVTLRWAETSQGRSTSFPENEGLCRALTDAAGRATLENLPDCPVQVLASKAGFEDEYGASATPGKPSRFTLRPAGALEGRITDPLGRPVEGATVSLYPKFRFHQYFLAKTDADGRYRVEKIWSDRDAHRDQPDWGKYEIAVRHPLLTAATREVSFSAGQTISGFDIAASPGVEIVGRVLDPATKASVTGVGVQVDSPSGRQTFLTGTDGGFHGRVMPGKISAFFWQPPRDSYVDEEGQTGLPSQVNAQASGERLAFDLYLPSALGRLGTVRGHVTGADGKPAARCEVQAVVATRRLRLPGWGGNGLRGVKTDGGGQFVIKDFPIGPAFTLNVRTENNTATGTLSSQLETDHLDLPAAVVLQPTSPGGEFLLTDRHGKPRGNLSVSVGPVPTGERYPVQGDRLKSDGAGVLRVLHFIPGAHYAITLTGADHVTRVVNAFDAPPAGSDVAVPPPRRTLVVDAQGVVRLLGPDAQLIPVKSIVNFEADTVLNGKRTRWSNALPVIGREGPDAVIPWDNLVGRRGDVCSFLVETDDGSFARAEGPAPTDGSNVFVIRTSEIIRPDTVPDSSVGGVGAEEFAGRVVTPAGEPIVGAAIETPGVHFQEEKVPPVLSGPDGTFRFAKPKFGISYLTVAKEGWATAFLTDATMGRGFRVTLRWDTRLQGTIGGESPGQVALLFKKNKFTRSEDSLDHEVRDVALRVSTDEHGAYDLPVEPGHYRWEASSADGRFANGEVEVGPGKATDLHATLQRRNDVVFELVDCQSGQPVPGIEVQISEQRADRVYSSRAGSIRTSDAEGRLRWENLPPGEKEFESQLMRYAQPASGRAQYAYTRWWRADEPVNWRQVDYAKQAPTGSQGAQWLRVDVKANMTPVRVFMERGVKISGRVVRTDGKGAAFANIQAVAQRSGVVDNFSARTDGEGDFLAYLPAGNGIAYNLCAYFWPEKEGPPSANVVSERFDSKPGDERTFELVMRAGGWFTGRLVTAAGQPAAGFKVTAVAADGLDSIYAARIATADADGRFRLGPLRSGKYEVHPGTGIGTPLRKLPGAKDAAGEIGADGDTRDLGDIALPAAAKRQD